MKGNRLTMLTTRRAHKTKEKKIPLSFARAFSKRVEKKRWELRYGRSSRPCAPFFSHMKKKIDIVIRSQRYWLVVWRKSLKTKNSRFFLSKVIFFFFHPSMFLTIPLGAEPRYEAIWFGFIIIFFFSLYFGFPAGELTCLPCIINKSTCSANGPPPTRRVGMAGVKKKKKKCRSRRKKKKRSPSWWPTERAGVPTWNSIRFSSSGRNRQRKTQQQQQQQQCFGRLTQGDYACNCSTVVVEQKMVVLR